ncbi:MAG TPA: hypothetical protein VJH03_23365 [Blastocatellia bacterium]|nr:hypothetical protein [Blastocatellia bacterium]
MITMITRANADVSGVADSWLGPADAGGMGPLMGNRAAQTYTMRHSTLTSFGTPDSGTPTAATQTNDLGLPVRAIGAGTLIANCTGVALTSYAVAGATGAASVTAN